MSFEFSGKFYQTDREGYLENPEDWDKEVGAYIADKVELELTPEHWKVIAIIRDYYLEYRYGPQIKVIVNEMKKRFEPERASRKYFYNLFPRGQYTQAYKIAGLTNACRWV